MREVCQWVEVLILTGQTFLLKLTETPLYPRTVCDVPGSGPVLNNETELCAEI